MPYTVGLYTLGCKVSQYETEAIGEAFERFGFSVVPFEDAAEVYVVNTCTVTAESDRKSRQMIRRCRKKNPNAIVLAVGCYAQASPHEIAAIPGVTYVSGTNGKMRLPEIALSHLESRPVSPVIAVTPLEGAKFEPMCIKRAPRTRAYVKIEDGCECRCAYCAIPGARGPVRSKDPLDVLSEVKGLVAGGTEEVVLTGIEAASYGRDLAGVDLVSLAELVEKESGISRIRFGSLTPEMMKPDRIARLAALGKICPHFHLSMQAGSDAVLRAMRRRYNTEMALSALENLRRAIPGVTFTTDMMVGFPGETEEQFEETLDFTRRANFLDMHVFAYSPRPGTPAAEFPDQVPEGVKRERSSRLIALKNELRQAHFARYVAEKAPLRVLMETEEGGVWSGHSDAFVPVFAPSGEDLHGRMVSVLPTAFDENGLFGEIVTDN